MLWERRGHITNLVFTPHTQSKCKTRSRNTIWFKPPTFLIFSWKKKIGKIFFKLLDTHFPKNSLLVKVFNGNTVKLSYSSTDKLENEIKNILLTFWRRKEVEKKKRRYATAEIKITVHWMEYAARKALFTLLGSVIRIVSRKNTLDVLRVHPKRDFIIMLRPLGWKTIEMTPSWSIVSGNTKRDISEALVWGEAS